MFVIFIFFLNTINVRNIACLARWPVTGGPGRSKASAARLLYLDGETGFGPGVLADRGQHGPGAGRWARRPVHLAVSNSKLIAGYF